MKQYPDIYQNKHSQVDVNLYPRFEKGVTGKVTGICVLILVMSFISCKKFVQIAPPQTAITNSAIFSSSTTANAASLNVFLDLAESFSWQLACYTGMSGDEITTPIAGAYIDDLTMYQNDMPANNENSGGLWATIYNDIYAANAVVDGVRASSSLTDSLKNQLIGEGEFSRAYLYFYLTNLFGDVPLVTSSDYTKSQQALRSTQSVVYQQILSDLSDAEKLLNVNYVGADGLTTSTQKVRPNKAAVTAFLARVYLYMGNWSGADSAATALLNSGVYKLVSDLNSVFLVNSNEAIFQTTFAPYNTEDGYEWLLDYQYYSLNPIFLANFENGDARRAEWIDSVISGSNIYYIPYKYKSASTTTITEYTMMLRYAEQYLIRAEAEAHGAGAGLSGAIADLNTIRKRAGLQAYSGATDQSSILQAILHENQVEFFSEEGHRWLDLKRTSSVDSVMARVNPLKGGAGWVSTQQLWPIPPSDILADPNLTQNNGY